MSLGASGCQEKHTAPPLHPHQRTVPLMHKLKVQRVQSQNRKIMPTRPHALTPSRPHEEVVSRFSFFPFSRFSCFRGRVRVFLKTRHIFCCTFKASGPHSWKKKILTGNTFSGHLFFFVVGSCLTVVRRHPLQNWSGNSWLAHAQGW